MLARVLMGQSPPAFKWSRPNLNTFYRNHSAQNRPDLYTSRISLKPFQLLNKQIKRYCSSWRETLNLLKKNSGISASRYLSHNLRISISSSHWTFYHWDISLLLCSNPSETSPTIPAVLLEVSENSLWCSKIFSHQDWSRRGQFCFHQLYLPPTSRI